MGKDLYDKFPQAKTMFKKANNILKFKITDVMFEGTDEDLRQTKVTQPAIFLHSVILASLLEDFDPTMVAGHSLGEFSALVANKVLGFEDGLRLVSKRAMAMQKACEAQPGTMAAVIGLEDSAVESICASVKDAVVVPANYNSPGQLVISGSLEGVEAASEKLKEAGASRTIVVGRQKVAEAPTDADFEEAAVYSIALPDTLDGLLTIRYRGDVARLYANGKLIDDNFYNGRLFQYALWRLPKDCHQLELRILPLQKEMPVYFPREADTTPGEAVKRVFLTY
jgi:[acyl-carrier-protein] S-malonyltransferase